jgi:hypothetical protein
VSVLIDPSLSNDDLRSRLYDGHLVVLTGLTAVQDLVDHTRSALMELFAPHPPEFAHQYFDDNQLAEMLATWKPAFIHSADSQRLVCRIIRAAGFDPDETHYDMPKPRTAFPAGHLSSGIAFAFPWHRDVWYSAPRQQINWWLPIFPVFENNSMSFDPNSFDRPVPNTSSTFDYYRNNSDRGRSASWAGEEKQARPAAVGHNPDQQLVVLPAPGAVLLFSGAQLHKTIPNTSGRSRFSVDFRTVHVPDLVRSCGAPLVDVHCTGTSIRDFRRVSDGGAFAEEFVTRLFGVPPPGSALVFVESETRDTGTEYSSAG